MRKQWDEDGQYLGECALVSKSDGTENSSCYMLKMVTIELTITQFVWHIYEILNCGQFEWHIYYHNTKESVQKECNQINSIVVDIIVWYSASIKDCDTISYFLFFSRKI